MTGPLGDRQDPLIRSKTDSTLLASPSLEKQGRQHLVSCV